MSPQWKVQKMAEMPYSADRSLQKVSKCTLTEKLFHHLNFVDMIRVRPLPHSTIGSDRAVRRRWTIDDFDDILEANHRIAQHRSWGIEEIYCVTHAPTLPPLISCHAVRNLQTFGANIFSCQGKRKRKRQVLHPPWYRGEGGGPTGFYIGIN